MDSSNAETWLDCLMQNKSSSSAGLGLLNNVVERSLNPPLTPVNLNDTHAMPKLLLLTPLKNADQLLERYFELLATMSYPKKSISLAFLVGDSTDDTYDRLLDKLQPVQHLYRRITVLRRDFNYELPNNKRKEFTAQLARRSIMARARNHLVTGALKDENWVLWWDVDLVEVPNDAIETMLQQDRDIVTANCYWTWVDGTRQPYDLNAWHETDASRAWAKTRDPNELFLEGYSDLWTRRKYLFEYADDPMQSLVHLDAVGGTLLLVKAEVHRSGILFPPLLYKHQVETEGFGLMANDAGYGVFGMPHLKILHLNA
ncbi:Anp1-domain-containing protein [Syncephalis fuscata]|nr:Anp1-domain-containing protein [Syncephalis fuscata]